MKQHELKINPVYFKEVKNGNKTFEVRKNDRDFRQGDIVHLREWTEELGYHGSSLTLRIGYVLELDDFFNSKTNNTAPQNYVVFSLHEGIK